MVWFPTVVVVRGLPSGWLRRWRPGSLRWTRWYSRRSINWRSLRCLRGGRGRASITVASWGTTGEPWPRQLSPVASIPMSYRVGCWCCASPWSCSEDCCLSYRCYAQLLSWWRGVGSCYSAYGRAGSPNGALRLVLGRGWHCIRSGSLSFFYLWCAITAK